MQHGQIQTNTVKRIIPKEESWGAGYYGHTIYFTDGTKGELYKYKYKTIPFKEGDTLGFKTSKSRFDDKPYLHIISINNITLQEIAENIPRENSNNSNSSDEDECYSSAVKEFTLKKSGFGGYYTHRILFENGIQGELSRCEEKTPEWLKKGKVLNFYVKEGKKADMPFIVLSDSISDDEPVHINKDDTSKNSSKRTNNNNNNPNQSYKPSSRLDDNPKYWFIRQSCISITTCLDRANELVIAGVIDNDKRYEQALQDFNFILEYAGINEKKELAECFKTSVSTKGKKYKEKENKNEINQPALFNSEEIPDKKEKKK